VKVLLCTDGAPCAQLAAALFSRIVLPADLELSVLHVAERHEPFVDVEAVEDAQEREVLREITSGLDLEAGRLLEAEVECLRRAGFSVDPLLRSGDIVSEVNQAAQSLGIDLIVVCSRGRETPTHVGLGREARRILKHAPCSVLVVRESATEVDEVTPGPRVLVAFDGSVPARKALDQVASLTLGPGAEVTLLTVLTVGTTLYGSDVLERMSETWRNYKERATRELEQAAERLSSHANVSVRILDGGPDPTDEILDAARILLPDLLAIGHTGKRALQRFLMGSVSEEVVDAAPCSVWVARAEDQPMEATE
jgi:nucleotide-binding universal stress UspA family protein